MLLASSEYWPVGQFIHAPSVTVFRYSPKGHALPQILIKEMQYMPLKELHAAVPHEQSIELSEEPSLLVHGLPREQVLVEEVQKRPEAAVHPVSPHTHGAALEIAPSVCVQSGAATQRQKEEDAERHDLVEVNIVLKNSPFFFQVHPGA